MQKKEQKRKRSYRYQKELAWKSFSLYIRTRDCLATTRTKERGFCITCNYLFNFDELQAGHFIPGRHNSVLFEETCVHAQCAGCNKNGGEILKYRRAIIAKYGEGYDLKLEQLDKQTRQYKQYELEEIEEKYRQKLQDLIMGEIL